MIDSEPEGERKSRRYDRFRNRVMFPILDARGNVIGFGGRVIGAGEPKYLNSPETPLFEKGRELYGLYQARRAIRETRGVPMKRKRPMPSQSTAYTDVPRVPAHRAKAGKLRKKKPRPAP